MAKNSTIKALVPLLALTLAGCGGGGSDDVVVGGSGGGGGGGGNGGATLPPGQSTNYTFQYPNFPNGGRVTTVATYQVPGESSSVSGDVFAAVRQGPFDNLAKLSVPGSSQSAAAEATSLDRCGTADIVNLTSLTGIEEAPEVNAQADPRIRARFQELAEGTVRTFYLITAYRSTEAAKMLQPSETQHCTIFAELDAQGNPCISRAKALRIAQAFDSNNPRRPGSGIYGQVRAAFGSEWNQNPVGGADGDTKVVLFFYRSLGDNLYGYTSPADSSVGSQSNQAEIVYINANKDDDQTLSTLTHEFQHLINHNEKVVQQGTFPQGAEQGENVSINEGLSQLAEEICGFDFNNGNTLLVDVCNDYLTRPESHEFFNFRAAGFGYGQSYLFFKYIREHYGDATIRALTDSPAVGKANLDAQLPNGFAENFRRWAVANYATNLNGNVPAIYKYPSGFRTDGTYSAGQLSGVRLNSLTNNSGTDVDSLRAWSAAYLSYSGGNGDDLTLQVESAPGSPVLAVYEALQGTFSSLDQ